MQSLATISCEKRMPLTIFVSPAKKKGWSNWGNWSPCDKNCTKERERFCSADDIKKCPGADGDRIELQKAKCPMDECYGK